MNRQPRTALDRSRVAKDLSGLFVSVFEGDSGKARSIQLEDFVKRVIDARLKEEFQGNLTDELIEFLVSLFELTDDDGQFDPSLLETKVVMASVVPARNLQGAVIPNTYDILLPSRNLRYSLAIAVAAANPPIPNVNAVGTTMIIRDILPGRIVNGAPQYGGFVFNGEVEIDIANVSGVTINVSFAPNTLVPKRTYTSLPPGTSSGPYALEGGSDLHIEWNLNTGTTINGFTEIALNNVNFLDYAAILAFNASGTVNPVEPFTPIPPLNPIVL